MHAHLNIQPSIALQRHSKGSVADNSDDSFDLRDALEAMIVREASFSEFRAALVQYREQLH
jgi:hypothetical protein